MNFHQNIIFHNRNRRFRLNFIMRKSKTKLWEKNGSFLRKINLELFSNNGSNYLKNANFFSCIQITFGIPWNFMSMQMISSWNDGIEKNFNIILTWQTNKKTQKKNQTLVKRKFQIHIGYMLVLWIESDRVGSLHIHPFLSHSWMANDHTQNKTKNEWTLCVGVHLTHLSMDWIQNEFDYDERIDHIMTRYRYRKKSDSFYRWILSTQYCRPEVGNIVATHFSTKWVKCKNVLHCYIFTCKSFTEKYQTRWNWLLENCVGNRPLESIPWYIHHGKSVYFHFHMRQKQSIKLACSVYFY